ncbi:hypothetical protein COLO4_08939 [Corchorus olitorius]|uniref:F-box domain-containing protein n=1 Tax=Corchorus olitorius TaxID=93759 RepID=A0A1R3KE31_9ROSI|nr:hypothetical protein COLO4_08939 [Corchorus olitorius]
MEEKKRSKSSNSNSAEQIGYNEGLLTEILLKVPTRSLLKFKLVSKQWMSLISSTHFCVTHTRTQASDLKPSALFIDGCSLSPSKIPLLPIDFDSTQRFPPFDFIDPNPPPLRILQSCSGLLICSSVNKSTYYICNPTTKKFKKFTFRSKDCSDVAVNLAFDPLKSPHYKVIFVAMAYICTPSPSDTSQIKRKCYIEIYSSEPNPCCSSKIEFDSKEGVSLDHGVCSSKIEFDSKEGVSLDNGVFCNGSIHWYSYQELHYLDLDKECVTTMSMPRVNNVTECYFGASGGHLNYVCGYLRDIRLGINIYEMEQDYSKWNFKYNLTLAEIITAHWSDFHYSYLPDFLLMCAINSGDEGYSFYAVFPDGRAISYNFKNGTSKALQLSNIKRYNFGKFPRMACQYIESLAWV